MVLPDPTWQMWVTFAFIAVGIALYASERFPVEQISLGLIAAFLLLFQIAPLTVTDGVELTPRVLLAGFAEPALISILCLMVVGQGLVRTGALDGIILRLTTKAPLGSVALILLVLFAVAVLSAFINNTPIVIVFIPVIAAIAEKMGWSPSRLMLPLSYVAILGGMTTLIGSSTNLLAAGAYNGLGYEAIGFFDFVVPGAVLAIVGTVYVVVILPRMLPDRHAYTEQLVGQGKQFIAQIEVLPDSPLVGQEAVAGMFPQLAGMTVRLVQRGGHADLPPFEDLILRAGDIVVVAATRDTLAQALHNTPGLVKTEDDNEEDHEDPVLAETMVAPGSRIEGRNLRQVGFHFHTGCVVLGVQRRSRMLRESLDEIRLEAGDVLLVHGPRDRVRSLRGSREVLLMEWSAQDLPIRRRANWALAVFAGVILTASTGLLPIVVAAVAGAVGMLLFGCLNVHQAARAIDRRVGLLVASALTLGSALQGTGGAAFLADGLISLLSEFGPAMVLSALFLLIAILTNLLSNNATAVLFTPIAVNTAVQLGVSPLPFVYAVIFAANCSFATPMGYQTNLLVMGPGHYRFIDYARGGIPLMLLLWLVFSLFAPWYYDF
jgi:di/tricarboxylate transporter